MYGIFLTFPNIKFPLLLLITTPATEHLSAINLNHSQTPSKRKKRSEIASIFLFVAYRIIHML